MFFWGGTAFFYLPSNAWAVVCALAYMAVYTLLKKYALFCSIKLLVVKTAFYFFFLAESFFTLHPNLPIKSPK